MANDLTFNQLSTLLNEIQVEALGDNASITPVDSSTFVTVGARVLQQGYDTVINSISVVLSRTLFSMRPYEAKFKGLQVSNIKFGNIVRKLSIADKDFEDDQRQPLIENGSIDHYEINNANVLELNFYGANVYQKHVTRYKDQLDQAFSSANEFGSFMSMLFLNASDLLEQARENLARAMVANYVSGKTTIAGDGVVHLITEYNASTGLALTRVDIEKPENYKPFMQWVDSRIRAVSEMMTERTRKFHTNVTGKEISRHTPKRNQKMYLLSTYKFGTESRVLADVFNDKFVNELADAETINFWQNPNEPSKVSAKATYLDTDGTLITTAETVEVDDVFGVLVDDETIGYTLVNQYSLSTPMNAAGAYMNTYWHETARYWIDYTENGVVFLMD